MPHDVFISHSKDDRLTAYALCNRLESAGVRCWIGPRDVDPGVDWGAAIIEAINGCRIMVLIFSLKANSSRHVHREVQRAFDKNLTVIPFRVENAEPTGTLEYYLSSVHWLDAITPPLEEHLETVARRVKALLLPASVIESATRMAATNPPPLPQTTISKPTDSQIRVQPDASETQSDPQGSFAPSTSSPPSETTNKPADSQIRGPFDASETRSDLAGNRRSAPPPLPPTAFARKRSPVPREKLVRNRGTLSPGHLLIQRKEILLSIGSLAMLNVIGVAVCKVGSGAGFFLLGLVFVQVGVFFLIGREGPENRWLRLLIVAIGTGLIMSIIYVFWGLGRGWLLLATGIGLSMGSGGALSIFAGQRKEKSPLAIVAVGAGLGLGVCLVVLWLMWLTAQETRQRWDEEEYPRREERLRRP